MIGSLNLENKEDNKKIIDCIEDYIELINKDNAILNEKFYKNGFKDGVNLLIECI